MRKNKCFLLVLVFLMLVSLPAISSIKISDNNEIDFSINVEKKALGWHITVTLVNEGDNWLYVEKNGYGDIGCVIYDEGDNEIWWTYDPDNGGDWQIGPGATYESFTIWTGTHMDRTKVPKGSYKIVGKAGYFENNEYVPLETEDHSVQVEKAKTKFFLYNNFLFRLTSLLEKFNQYSTYF